MLFLTPVLRDMNGVQPPKLTHSIDIEIFRDGILGLLTMINYHPDQMLMFTFSKPKKVIIVPDSVVPLIEPSLLTLYLDFPSWDFWFIDNE